MIFMFYLFVFVISFTFNVCVGQTKEELLQGYSKIFNIECLKGVNLETVKTHAQICLMSEYGSVLSSPSDDVSKKIETFITESCKKPTIPQCLKIAVDPLDPCLLPEARKPFEMSVKSLEAGLLHICQNNGERIKKIIDMEMKHSTISNCTKKVGMDLLQCTQTYQNWVMEHGLPHAYTKIGCQEQEKYRKCLVSGLRKCEEKSIAEFFDDLVVATLRATTCKDHLDLSAAGQLTFTCLIPSVLSIALLTVLS